MLNDVNLMGRLVDDARTIVTPEGNRVSNYTIAIERDYKKGDIKPVDYISIVSWNLPDWIVNERLLKGKGISVKGRLQSRIYEKDDGQKIYITEVITESVYAIDFPTKQTE